MLSPSFIGIGAEKSATTWVWTMLDAHPDVCMSQPKELNFFNIDENFRRGPAWYQQHFTNTTSICGEISPLYMDHPAVAERMAGLYPNAKILVILRDPFDRAISHLFHDASVQFKIVANLTVEHLKNLAEKDSKYIRRSCYAQALTPFFDNFAPENIGVFFFDEIKQDPLGLAQQIYRFANVDDGFVPECFNEKVNQSQDLRRIAGTMIGLSKAARSFPVTRPVMEWIYRHTRFRERAINWLMVDKGRPKIDFDNVFDPADADVLFSDLQNLTALTKQLPTAWRQPQFNKVAA